MKQKVINVTDYTRTPGGRFRSDGKGNGQEFREDFIEPIWKDYDKIIINFKGASGYPSSFLEEVFGGLVRKFGLEEIQSKLVYDYPEDTFVQNEIKDYIERAAK